jgi:hypothetical protein
MNQQSGKPGDWKSFFSDKLPLQSETCFFILVSALDVYATYLLLARGGHEESNPFARFFFDRWGMDGMIAFKFTSVAVVCVIAQIIARRKLMTARLLLIFLTLLVSAVVVYSLYLLAQTF